MGFVYGPLGAFLPSLFPPLVRYTGASMTFNIAGILGAAPVPAVAQYLSDHGGLGYVGYYLSGSAILSLAALPEWEYGSAGTVLEVSIHGDTLVQVLRGASDGVIRVRLTVPPGMYGNGLNLYGAGRGGSPVPFTIQLDSGR